MIVSSYKDITARMDEGTVNRTVASTNMNATSSRAHTIVGINFVQKSKNEAGKEMAKVQIRATLLVARKIACRTMAKNSATNSSQFALHSAIRNTGRKALTLSLAAMPRSK